MKNKTIILLIHRFLQLIHYGYLQTFSLSPIVVKNLLKLLICKIVRGKLWLNFIVDFLSFKFLMKEFMLYWFFSNAFILIRSSNWSISSLENLKRKMGSKNRKTLEDISKSHIFSVFWRFARNKMFYSSDSRPQQYSLPKNQRWTYFCTILRIAKTTECLCPYSNNSWG